MLVQRLKVELNEVRLLKKPNSGLDLSNGMEYSK